ncbi:hypothetical protein LTR36_000173 [Oleoguttula mirabilis]|uniref:Uncharacterized protein n=1 Tax=Oleoguttula mirabilis TaxID=1507867 RepID=A0AAV9JY74_9PEZI|nr:hypothetical protein LTR36_000173 [Oleoguttula mirabilis]
MTTRRRAQKPTTNGSPSINGSVDDDYSRRSSLDDDARPTTSHSQISQASANGVHVPEIFESDVTPEVQFDSAQSSAESRLARRSGTKPLSPVQQAPSPSRKRKRSSPTPPTHQNRLFVTPTPSQHLDEPTSDEEDAVEPIDPTMLSDRQISETSSESGEQIDEAAAVAIHSVDDTPAASAAISPASSVSADGDAAKAKHMEDIADTVMHMDGAEVAEDAEEVDDGDEIDEQVRTDEEGRPTKRIGGKRRRGPHPDSEIEATMRRQLDLRRAYRTVARDLKAVLAEIGRRTVIDLITNPSSSEEAAEHQEVEAGLLAAFEKRCAILRTHQTLDRKLLEQRLHDETQIANSTYRLQVADAQDTFLDRMEREILSIGRAAQSHATTEQLDTDNEDDDIIPRPKRMAYRWKRGEALDPVYDSRSLPAIETEQALNDMGKRLAMRKMLQELTDDDEPAASDVFTVMDRATREAAQARHQETANTNILADAANEVERIANIAIIPNEQAVGLQLLGDLAIRPSITVSAQDTVRAKLDHNSMARQTPSRSIPPPIVPPLHETHPIEFNASPRAQQIFRERYDASMPPPRTPRQDNATFAPSPDFQRRDTLPSPTTCSEHTNGLQPIAAKSSEDQHGETPHESPFRPLESDRRFVQGPDRREDVQPPRLPHTNMPDRVQALAGVPDRRSRSLDERYPYDTAYGGPPSVERPDTKQPGAQNDSWRRDFNNREPLQHSLLHSILHDRPASPGAVDQRTHRISAPFAERPRPSIDPPRSPHSRRSSVSIKQEARSEGSQIRDHPRPRDHQQAPVTKPKWTKTNLEERGGQPRRRRKNKEKKERQQSLGTPAFSGPSQVGATPFARSPVPQAPHPQAWQPPPTQQPAFPLPRPPQMAPPPFGPQHRGPPQQPYAFDQPRHEFDYAQQNHQHRNSYPPPQPSPAPNWGQPPPSSLYALPSGQQRPPPPPPGVPPGQYHGHHALMPPPPPQYYPQTPTSTQSQSGPGSYGQQFGGPAIAPATPDLRFHPPGFVPGPARLPAFAQQQRNNEGQRRRTQSEVHHDRRQWNSYQGPNGRH